MKLLALTNRISEERLVRAVLHMLSPRLILLVTLRQLLALRLLLLHLGLLWGRLWLLSGLLGSFFLIKLLGHLEWHDFVKLF